MPEKNFGIRDIVPNNIRDNVPNTKNLYFQMSSTMSLIPKKKKTVGIRDIVPNTEFCVTGLPGKEADNVVGRRARFAVTLNPV